jgi:hypothetical protein
MHFPEGTLKQIYFDQLQASIGGPPWVIRRTLNVAGVTMVVLHAARSWKGLGADAEPIEDQAAEVDDWSSPDNSDVEELTRR